MVDRDIAARGIRDSRVILAMARVPREEFVDSFNAARAYDDSPLSIGYGQTISQPYIVALALEALAIDSAANVLDVGCGSGYAAAIMSTLAAKVTSIERIPALADAAAKRLTRLGFDNVEVVCGDGSIGYDPASPYDAICVSAAGPRISDFLTRQLCEGGRLVMPVAKSDGQVLVLGIRHENELDRREIASVRFVPLVGEGGFGSAS